MEFIEGYSTGKVNKEITTSGKIRRTTFQFTLCNPEQYQECKHLGKCRRYTDTKYATNAFQICGRTAAIILDYNPNK